MPRSNWDREPQLLSLRIWSLCHATGGATIQRGPRTAMKSGPRGFPGGAVVESPPAGAGDAGSGPGLGGSRVPRSGWAREPQLLSLRVWSLCSATGEAAKVRAPCAAMGGGPRLPRLERALSQRLRHHTAKSE